MIVLDTHVWLWWVAGSSRLTTEAALAIDESPRIGVPAICAWEIGMLVARRRIGLDRPTRMWISQALAHPRVETLDLDSETAVAASELDPKAFPGDPADRMIYAAARRIGAPLVTRDEAIRRFDPRNTIW